MKKPQKTSTRKESLETILKRLVKRIEEATVDIHSMKRDLKFSAMGLRSVESNIGIIKVDIEKLREDTEKMKKDIHFLKINSEDIIENTTEIIAKMVTQDELKALSSRVTSLEQQ